MPTLSDTATLLHLLGDPTRVRLLALLARDALTVAELTSITQLAQSSVSTHLGKLREAELLHDRRVGASTFYSLDEETMPTGAKKVWSLVSQEVDDDVLETDRNRSKGVVRARGGGAPWPEAIAGHMEQHYSPGRTWEAMARGFLGLMALGDVLDAGCGDGTVAQLLAPRERTICCVDESEKMVGAARARLSGVDNVRLLRADAHELPLQDETFDHVLLLNVLTCTQTPARVLVEAARVLRKGGSVVVVTLGPHDHLDVTAPYRHLHGGFRPSTLQKMLQKAGLRVDRCDVTSRERREPYFQVVTAFATKG
ncbi:MAG: metalloregulator ArsR/SmtB family transcription factor [Polyangiales bacterium]